jgi:hypothetical protein
MNTYISSIESKKQKNAINSCLKSVNNLIDSDTDEEGKQYFSEIVWTGKVDSISKAKITNPRKLGMEIPVIGNISGFDMIVGYTDGMSIRTEQIPENFILSSQSTAEEGDVPSQDYWGNRHIYVEITSGIKVTVVTISTTGQDVSIMMRF